MPKYWVNSQWVVVDADYIAPIGGKALKIPDGTAAKPGLMFDNATVNGIFNTSTSIQFSIAGVTKYYFSASQFRSQNNFGFWLKTVAGSVTDPTFAFRGDEDTGAYRPGADIYGITVGAIQAIGISEVASIITATWKGKVANNTATMTTGASDAVDASAINVLFLDTSGGNITIGAFVGGVAGQVLHVLSKVIGNNVTLEHNEGTGNQNIFLHKGVDETLDNHFGGWTLVCDGTSWFDNSHAQHV